MFPRQSTDDEMILARPGMRLHFVAPPCIGCAWAHDVEGQDRWTMICLDGDFKRGDENEEKIVKSHDGGKICKGDQGDHHHEGTRC